MEAPALIRLDDKRCAMIGRFIKRRSVRHVPLLLSLSVNLGGCVPHYVKLEIRRLPPKGMLERGTLITNDLPGPRSKRPLLSANPYPAWHNAPKFEVGPDIWNLSGCAYGQIIVTRLDL